MRASTIFLTGLFAAFTAAQSTTVPAPATSIDPATAAQSSQAAEITRCLQACDESDVNCRSRCIAVPNPNEDQVNETNNCVAGCPKGNGTESDIAAYGTCVQNCIGQHYFTTGGTPQATNAPGSGNGGSSNNGGSNGNDNEGGSNGGESSGSGTTGNEPSQSGGAASASSSSAAAPSEVLRMTGSAVGLVGFLAAVLAL